MSKLTKREQYLVVVALIFAVLALLAYSYYFPLQNELTLLEQESSELSLEIEEAKNRVLMIEATKKEIKQVEEEIAAQREFLMESLDETEILYYLSGIILDSGNLSSVNYSFTLDNEMYYTKDLDISFTSSYSNLKTILTAFEDGDRFTIMPSMSVSPVGDTSQEVETTDEEGNVIQTQVPVPNSDVIANLNVRFYGSESSWDGSGEYDFMDGSFGKDNIFK